jgi:hypothetical protein
MSLNVTGRRDTEYWRPRYSFAVLLLVPSVVFALPGPLTGQEGDRPKVLAVVYGDSMPLAWMHSTTTDADGVTVSGQAFYSSAKDLADRELPELVIAPSEIVRIAMEPSADSVWVTPVVGGGRQSPRVIEAGFHAPSTPGRYEFFVSGWWTAHPDGSRPPSGPARTGSWALRLIVR